MKTKHAKMKILVVGLCLATVIGIMSFQDSSVVRSHKMMLDTLPKSPDIHIDVDLKHLENAMKELNIQMENVGKNLKDIDWQKITNEVNQSLKHIDLSKIQLDIEKSMKDIDWNKMKADVEKSMKDIDWNKIKLEMNHAMKDVDMKKIKEEIERSMKDVKSSFESEDFKKSMEELKNLKMDDVKIELDKARKELEKNKDQFGADMAKARIEMEKAKGDMQKAKEDLKIAKGELDNIKELVTELEKDGLIDTKKSYNVEYKDKELYINGKKQPTQVKDKYKKYIKGEQFKLSRNHDGALALPPGCSNGLWISAYI